MKIVNENFFQSADEGNRFFLMFSDSQIAKGYKLIETKIKYKIHHILEICKKMI